ncbi:MAG: GGDEF domain-containing protein [Kangiellaceae bacterium]|nr:GGDEF domain-containing protein [Kangiellaceae bacterium]MCW9017344.1 GGDEF domain-containing protein [Kangiellaceae bacterium]
MPNTITGSLNVININDRIKSQAAVPILNAMPGLAFLISEDGLVMGVYGNHDTKPIWEEKIQADPNLSHLLPAIKSAEILFNAKKALNENVSQYLQIMLTIQNKNRQFEGQISPIEFESECPMVVLFAKEVNRESSTQDAIAFLANHDNLTGIAMQKELEKCLEKENQLCIEHELFSTLAYIDVDEFKSVNTQFGRAVGDEVLCQIAARLESQTRQNDFVSHYKSDEFVMIFPNIGKNVADAVDESANIASKIKQTLSAPILIDGEVIQLSASIGISVLPQKNKSAVEILKDASGEMRQRRDSRKGYLTTFS